MQKFHVIKKSFKNHVFFLVFTAFCLKFLQKKMDHQIENQKYDIIMSLVFKKNYNKLVLWCAFKKLITQFQYVLLKKLGT